jgi:Flp pilus assembly pilin Flp
MHAPDHQVPEGRENAATAIEYGLIVAERAIAIIPAITRPGAKLKTTFSTLASVLK